MTTPALTGLQVAAAAAYLIVGLLALRHWVGGGEPRRGYLALAFGSLGLVALSTPVEALVGHRQVEASISIVLFMAAAAGMLLYRNSLVPLSRAGIAVATTSLVGVTVLTFASGLPWAPTTGTPSPFRAVVADALIAIWCAAVVEPGYRLLRVSLGLPRVQRARMRSMALGYLILAADLVAAIVASGRVRNASVGIALESVALACVPLFYLSFAPPRMLRRLWRQAEQEELGRAIRDLLLFSPDRATLGARALDWAVRLVGGSAGVIADTNQELLALQGMSETEALALLQDARLHDGSPPVRLSTDGTSAISQALAMRNGPGQVIVVSGALSPWFGDDEVQWLRGYAPAVAIALDRSRITEWQAQTEADLRAARDSAEEANRAKSEFLSRMSHELRTPLTSVIGFAELLLVDRTSDARDRYARTILRAGEHLLGLINDILDIARIEEGHLSLSPEAVDVGLAVREVLDLVRPMIEERRLTVKIVDMPQLLSASADRQRLTQILLNLLTNAVKYNHDGGWIEISAQPVDERVRISVSDSGKGLLPGELDKLFFPFERLSAASSDVQGTGLGLALSKSLLEAMGGSIGVESTAGKGSIFWIELPRSRLAVETAGADGPFEKDGEERCGRGAGVVIYADDNPANVQLVEGILAQRPGIRLISAMQGRVALELARQHRPDLILLDIHLPDISGDSVIRHLAEDPRTATIPVVVISADATLARRQRVRSVGAQEFLTKPIRVATLLAALDRYLPAGLASETSDDGAPRPIAGEVLSK